MSFLKDNEFFFFSWLYYIRPQEMKAMYVNILKQNAEKPQSVQYILTPPHLIGNLPQGLLDAVK